MSTLLIVALASALVYQMISHHALTIAHAKLTFEGTQAREYVLGAEAFARQLLHEDWLDEETRKADTLAEDWATAKAPFAIDGGELSLAIVDLDRRLDLNGVVGEDGPNQLARLKCLFQNVELDPNLADAWLDWVDEDREVHGFGAEDDVYLLADPPYRTANHKAAGVSELRAVVEPEAYEALRPHVAATPAEQPRVNVNTAGYEVLRCLNLAEDVARRLVESEREYQEVTEAAADNAALGASIAALAVTSEFFEVSARAEVRGARAELKSVLHRDPTTGTVRLLARDYGHRFETPQADDENPRTKD